MNPAERDTAGPLESPAYPPLVRILAVVLIVDLLAFGLWSLPALRSAVWSTPSLLLFGGATACIAWVGYWIVYSRTRLEGDVLTQTWIWNRRADAAKVTQLKLVHWRWVDRIVAPRLLVRQGPAVTWFHSADARLLTRFAERVAERLPLDRATSSAQRPG
ncbi:hypothetical protein H4CHR_04707 [Variovorax sp. PBS-H4]|uniref:hypothetical protein n=1 Tax=Variovorax sp. PBS-H4 TaxID=434008 RepID=UPI001316D339|nr:hypothetical protein [Variovorax sp. PBS-H4]VTU39495.1 hypothetical protein H4CHR_04707 [Variovorax sp. PBS-H4]